jgi:hypothetical protein
MMWSWLDTKQVDEFGSWVVAELCKRYPPEGVDANPKKAAERLRKTHDSLLLRVEAFAREHRLNLYKKARLGNKVKWALREAGYPPQFVDTFTHELVTVVTVVNARGRKPAPKR